MLNKIAILIYLGCASLMCHGAIWKTEDAYIIDDFPDDGAVITENPNVCTDSSGAPGQCILMEECNGHYKYFESQKNKVWKGLERYLNGTNLESCVPSAQDGSSTETTTVGYYVCCTSVKYANAKSISLEEYKAKTINETLEEAAAPNIEPATISLVNPLIVDGEQASLGEFPFAVAIIFRGQQICGGSLIDSRWVISAAHCFDKFNSQSVRQLVIKIGDHDITRPGEAQHQDIYVAKLFLHPGFFRDRNFFRDDVALIKLRSPVSPGGNIRTVQLHSGSPSLSLHSVQATVCGWGKTCGGDYCGQSSVLRKAKLNIVSNSQCSQRYAGTKAPPITQNMICAGGLGRKDSCNGDSGGPLIIYSGGQTYQIGIVSWGIGCGQYPGVYTRISSFVSWIAKHKQR